MPGDDDDGDDDDGDDDGDGDKWIEFRFLTKVYGLWNKILIISISESIDSKDIWMQCIFLCVGFNAFPRFVTEDFFLFHM